MQKPFDFTTKDKKKDKTEPSKSHLRFCIHCLHYQPDWRWCKRLHITVTRQIARIGRTCTEYERL